MRRAQRRVWRKKKQNEIEEKQSWDTEYEKDSDGNSLHPMGVAVEDQEENGWGMMM